MLAVIFDVRDEIVPCLALSAVSTAKASKLTKRVIGSALPQRVFDPTKPLAARRALAKVASFDQLEVIAQQVEPIQDGSSDLVVLGKLPDPLGTITCKDDRHVGQGRDSLHFVTRVPTAVRKSGGSIRR